MIFGVREGTPSNIIVGSAFADGTEGGLEQEIYHGLRIRVSHVVLRDECGNRVLVLTIPSRPIGKVYTFEDTPLMRVGDSLERMSDEEYIKAIQEQEPDFSSLICPNVSIEDLDDNAIDVMKLAYSRKQANPIFRTLGKIQILSDLNLIKGERVTYAGLILLGKESVIKELLPQAAIHLELRGKTGQITFDKRDKFIGPYFLVLERLWAAIDSRNGSVPVQQGPYIFDIPYFNQEVIREAINNAVAHRDYRISSEILLKQYPHNLTVLNPGGFPKGVNIDNLLTVSSTPRNRLLTEILEKTGIVERSGQGVDKIYYQCLSEAKGEPDYTKSDDFQVELHLPGIVQDRAFALFISHIQNQKRDDEKFSVQEVITMEKVRLMKPTTSINKDIVEKLIREGWVEKRGKTRSTSYQLSKLYFEFTNRKAEYSNAQPIDQLQTGLIIMNHLKEFKGARMDDFVKLLNKYYTREQIKTIIYKLNETGVLKKEGKGKGTKYAVGEQVEKSQQLFSRAVQLGIQEMVRLGEIKQADDARKDT